MYVARCTRKKVPRDWYNKNEWEGKERENPQLALLDRLPLHHIVKSESLLQLRC